MAEDEKKETSMESIFLTTEQLAVRWQMSTSTLAHWLVDGKGPKYIQMYKRILYPIEEVEIWEKSRIRRSTVG